MESYYTIHNLQNPQSEFRRLVVVCHTNQQAWDTYKWLLKDGSNMELRYLVLERVETDPRGLVVYVRVLAQEWVQ